MQPVLILRAGYLASYVHALRKLGIDPDPLLDHHHLPTASEHLPEYMISGRDTHAFIEQAVAHANPGVISMMAGFHHAHRQSNPFREGATGAINLLEAIERHNEEVTSYGPGARFTLRLDDRGARWIKTTRSPMAETEIFCVANLIGHVRSMTHPRWLPYRVEVGVAAPEDLARLPELAGIPVEVSEDLGTHICFPIDDVWQVPPGRGDAAGSSSKSGRIEEPDFVESISLLMKGFARTGCLRIENTARAARLSVRTLQRRLRAAGVSHAQLADQARFAVACDLLNTAREMTVTEIGFELGYQDPGSFSRAFRRMAGMPPAEYRRGQSLGPQRSSVRATEISPAATGPG